MKIPRRRFLQLAAGAAALTAGPRAGLAQAYPTRNVRLVVGFPAGSSADIIARLMGQWLGERLGQPFIVDDRPGAASNIATENVVRAAPDGYTLLWTTPANAISQSFYSNLTFNFLGDTTPIAGVMRTPCVLVVSPNFPAKTLPEFIAYAKAHPGKVTMASGGNGGTPHVTGELFKMMAGVELLHVPYRGDAPAMTDLLGGQVDMTFSILSLSSEYIRAGKVRPLAVTTTTRWPTLPDVPAVSELIPGYEAVLWHGLSAPKNLPADIVERLNKAIAEGLGSASMKARLADVGAEPMPMTSDEFGKFLARETEKWSQVVKFSGAKAN